MNKLRNPEYLNLLQFYQWIFCIFGSNLPPILYRQDFQGFQRQLFMAFYGFYAILLFAVTIFANCVHNTLAHTFTMMNRLDCITELLSYGHNTGLIFAYGTMEASMFWQRNRLTEILKDIQEMENELMSMNEVTKTRVSLKWKLFRISGIWLIFASGNFLYLTYFLTGGRLMHFSFKFIISLFVVAIQLKFVEYGVYVQIINDIMEQLYNALEAIKCNVEHFPRPVHGGLPHLVSHQLLRNQQLLRQLWLLVHKINRYFALPLGLMFYQNGVAILFTVNWSYVRSLFESDDTNQICKSER